jgi:hypothetical protein
LTISAQFARERFALDSSATLAVMLRPRKVVLELAARGQYERFKAIDALRRRARLNSSDALTLPAVYFFPLSR